MEPENSAVHFRPVTEENFQTVIAMKRPEGERFVASNAYSLAQAWLYREAGDVYPTVIYAGETPVGFLLLDEDREERCLTLWRIMFPVENQNRGYGTQAVRLLIRLARESGKYDHLLLTCAPANEIGRHVYEKLGFRPTGEICHGEVEYRLELNAAP